MIEFEDLETLGILFSNIEFVLLLLLTRRKMSIIYIPQQMKDLLIISGGVCKSVTSEPSQQAISCARNDNGHLVFLTAHAFGWMALIEQLVGNLWNARSRLKGKKISSFRCGNTKMLLRLF